MQSLIQHTKIREPQLRCSDQCDSGICVSSSSELNSDSQSMLFAQSSLSNFGLSSLRPSTTAYCAYEKSSIQCSDADDACVDNQLSYGISHQTTDVNCNQIREDALERDFSRLMVTEEFEDEGLHSMSQQWNHANSTCLFSQPGEHVSSTATIFNNESAQSTSFQQCFEDSDQCILVATDDNCDHIKAVDLSQQDAEGDTALHVTVLGNFTDVAKTFVALASVWTLNIQNYLFQTALHLAVLTGQNDVVDALVSKGADVTLRDAEGNTPLHRACLKGNKQAVTTLISAFGNDTPALTKYLEMKNKDGHTCIHIAGLNRKLDIVEFLLAKGTNVNMGDGKSGRTLLHFAAEKRDIQLVNLLLRHRDTDVDCRTFKGETPLKLAFWRNFQDIVELLKQKGAYFSYEMLESSDEESS